MNVIQDNYSTSDLIKINTRGINIKIPVKTQICSTPTLTNLYKMPRQILDKFSLFMESIITITYNK